jgi:rhodanese-related sulfurtransferase
VEGNACVEACVRSYVSYIGHMVQAITPHQAQQLINRGEVEIIDVREPHEWAEGHLAGARLAPLAEFRANPKANLQRDGVVFVCAAGVRSETAARIAVSLGFSRVYNLTGGTRGWVRAGLDLVNDFSVAV